MQRTNGSPRQSTGRVSLLLFVLVAAVPFGWTQSNQSTLENLAGQIAEKRARLESLSDELELAKTQYNEELRSLATQSADVETQINRQELRLSQIEQDLEDARSEIQQAEGRVEGVEPLANQTMAQLRGHINAALPFQVSQRLAAVDTVERRMEDGAIEDTTAITRLWNMVDSEFRLATESGIYQQTISVEGESKLADVARLGTVLLYFRTFDGRAGYAVPTQDGWSYRIAASREEQEQITNLFESLRRNLREGFFEVPNPYATGGSR